MMIGRDRAISHRLSRTVVAAAAATAVLAGAAAPPSAPPADLVSQAVTPAGNPEVAESCGVDVTLVLDASGSVSSSGAVSKVSSAARAFLAALANTASTARVTQFATVSQQLAPRTLIDDAALADGGVLKDAVDGYYNPKPPRPADVTFREYRGGSLTNPGSFRTNNALNQYTNWDQGLDDAGRGASELIVFITDGDPTAFDLNQAGDPFDAGPPPDVAVKTDANANAREVTLDRAIEEANQLKAASTRILAVGVGSALSSAASRDRLVAISGPQVIRDADLSAVDSINEVDVALVTDFEDLAGFLRSVVLELCSPSLTVRKLAQSPGDADYAPAAGWDITVTPTVPGGTFDWILPDPGPGAGTPSKTVTTDAQGFAQFQWEPDPGEADSRALVAEALEPGFIAGRPAGSGLPPEQAVDWRCELKDERGNVRVVSGELAAGADPSFTLDPIRQEIVTCTIWNSYDYRPAIALAKVNAPTELRGDLDPPATVTSTYLVTNPGNTPLDGVTVADDRCAPVTDVVGAGGRNVGDITPADGRLDPGEQWQFACDRGVSTSPSANPAGQRIVNTATTRGVDPRGTVVTATATDDVHAFNPAISLTKRVNGAKAITISAGDTVTYTFDVENTGNTPLADIRLTDTSTPDSGCAPSKTDDGDGDAILAVGERWAYACTVALTADTSNVARVDGVPLDPVPDPDMPFPDPNPRVAAIDRADVTTIDADLTLTKVVDRSVVFPGTTVTYTYEATNTGTADLVNPDPTGVPGWVTDDTCAPAAYASGDANGDGRLNQGETWVFSCPDWRIDAPTRNVAEIVAQPVDAGGTPVGDPLTRRADAFVDVVTPGIALAKTALTPVVLDPDATPIGAPTVERAAYDYVVTNPGSVSLREVALVDDRCPGVTFVGGDVDGDGFLDVDEAWSYTCETVLEREDGTPPPTGAESGLVENHATVTGTPFLPETGQTTTPVTARDVAQVLVIEPRLRLTKTASADVVLPGANVTYTFVVENLGDVGLRLVGPVDDKCAPLAFVGGDDNGNDILEGANGGAGAESWTYRCTRPVGMPAPPATDDTNVAAVIGVDPLGNGYLATDTAVVRVIDPDIDLAKSVSAPLVPAGTVVTYEFAVTNAGRSPVAADDVLAEVTLVDAAEPAQPLCASPALVAKEGGNQDDLLDRDPAETWRYRCLATITDDTVNVAVVGARGGTQVGLNVVVLDIAAAYVAAFRPGLAVAKAASPTQLLGGGEVTYTYEVRNTGDVPLGDVAARIGDDTCGPVTYVGGDEDGDGLLDTPTSIFEDSRAETWTFSCTTYVDETTENTVTVVGTPTDPAGTALCPDGPCDVRGTDTEVVTVTQPGSITIVKQARGDEDGTFAFDGGLGTFRLATVDGSAARTFADLAPDTYVVAESVPSGWQLVEVVCQDPTGNTTLAESGARIVLDEGETVTCTFANAPIPGLPPTAMRMLGSILAPLDGPGGDAVRLAVAGIAGLVGLVGVLAFVAARGRRRAAGEVMEPRESA